MDELFEYLNQIGIIDPPDVKGVFVRILEKNGFDALCEVASKCYLFTEISAQKLSDRHETVFCFSAGSNVSGGVLPCSDPDCRIRNLYTLSAFSALYAEKVFILNPFEHVYKRLQEDFHFDSVEERAFFIQRLVGDIQVMLNLRPLFEVRLISINPQVRTFCHKHWEDHKKEAVDFQKTFLKIQSHLIDKLNSKVQFTLVEDGQIILRDPSRYIAMESFMPIKAPKSFKKYQSRAPYTFNAKETKNLKIWQPIILPAYEEVVFQKYSVLRQNAAYLTSYGIEKDIIEVLSGNEKINKSKDVMDALIHELPFVANVTLPSLIELRKRFPESFDVYRDKMSGLIRDCENKPDVVAVKEVVRDEILPELHKIAQVIRTNQDILRQQGRRKIIWDLALLLSAGVFGQNALTIGGAFTLKDIIFDMVGTKVDPKEARNDDYYFLWSIKMASEQ